MLHVAFLEAAVDLMLVAGIVGAGLIIFLIVLAMLNRAWGDFPGRISGLPPPMPTPGMSGGDGPRAPDRDAQLAQDTPPAPGLSWGEGPLTPPGSAPGSLIPVAHPLVRRAVEAALERGGSPYALYFVRDGGTIYLVPSRIADPQQRELVTRMFTSLNGGGGDLPMGDIMRAIQELGRR